MLLQYFFYIICVYIYKWTLIIHNFQSKGSQKRNICLKLHLQNKYSILQNLLVSFSLMSFLLMLILYYLNAVKPNSIIVVSDSIWYSIIHVIYCTLASICLNFDSIDIHLSAHTIIVSEDFGKASVQLFLHILTCHN